MDRRRLLFGVCSLAAIGWFRGVSMRSRMSEALARARDRRAFLLVFVVPTDVHRLRDRQHAFGELLTWADEATRLRLGAAELIAAPVSELVDVPHVYPPVGGYDGEPLFVIIDRGGVARTVYGHLPELRRDPEDYWVYGQDLRDQRVASGVQARIDFLQELLAEPLPSGDVPYFGGAPDGAEFWVGRGGCGDGAHPEGEVGGRSMFESVAGSMLSCGMGRVAAGSERFLKFLTTP